VRGLRSGPGSKPRSRRSNAVLTPAM
jgi:hypothetical protein